MNDSEFSDSLLNSCTFRRLVPKDAPGVTRLMESIYGDTYYPRDLYDPTAIVELNKAEKLVSVVTRSADGQVVGHYALERPRLGAVAEASDAIVAEAYRHHHFLEKMRLLLREEGTRLGLTGLVGYPVTNHTFSQLSDEHIGACPCGIALGLWPSTFHNMPEAMPQRMSFVIYFRFLRPTNEVVHVDTPHRELLSNVCRQFNVQVRSCAASKATGPGDMIIEHEPAVQTGTIHVRKVGTDTVDAVKQARKRLCEELGAKALTLELPLAQPATAQLCRAAEDEGFFFSGLGPAFAPDGDALLMQYITEKLDTSLIQIVSPLAKEMLAYMDAEKRRVAAMS